jgi:hypothetical protein
MKKIILTILLLSLATAHAQMRDRDTNEQNLPKTEQELAEKERLSDPLPRQLQFIGYSFLRTTLSNVTPTNDVLQGQVIGRMFGRNSTETVDRTAFYTEQRFVPLFIYKPNILDGYATFRGLFKIDYTWGDQSYGVGNNRGGGLSGGQVNLQTLMANVDLRPKDSWWNLVIGMQRIFDSPYDPNIQALDLFQNTGYKLSFWGTQATGVSWFARPHQAINARLGFYQLWENQVSRDQDVFITMADIMTRPHRKLELGFSAWYLRDTAEGAGGISILGQGLTSALAEYNGAPRIQFPGTNQRYKADIAWLGSNMNWNRNFIHGSFQFDAYVIANLGIVSPDNSDLDNVDMFGLSSNVSMSYRYGMTNNDKVWAEAIFTTGDGDGVSNGTINSVYTGNVWGSPVGIYSAHRSLLLFPDPQVVSRYYSMVHDISNMGLGVVGGTVNFMKDIVPHKFRAKVGGAVAFSNYTLDGGGNHIGTEINAELKYDLKVFLTIGLNAGYAFTGDFYDAPASTFQGESPRDPWVVFTSLSWLMFN